MNEPWIYDELYLKSSKDDKGAPRSFNFDIRDNKYLSEEQKHLISDPIWNRIVEPLSNILMKLTIVSKLWGIVLSIIDTKFPKPVPKAELNCSFDIANFNHSETVNENGGVKEEVRITHSVKIKNEDKSNTAKDVYLILKDPHSNEEGL